MEVIILDGNYSAAEASGCNDLVTSLQLIQHGLPFLLPPLLRHDEQKIENGKDEDERGEPEPSCRTAA